MSKKASRREYIVKVETWTETNPYYDPERSCNGGGYSQPSISGVITWKKCRKPIRFTLDDSSCGDFGSRICLALSDGPVEMCGEYCYDSMDDDSILESTIPDNAATRRIREALKERIGYGFRLATEC